MSWWWETFDQHQIESYVGRVAHFNDALLKESGGQISMGEVSPEGNPLYTATVKTPKARYLLILNRSLKAISELVPLPAALAPGSTAYDTEADRPIPFPPTLADKRTVLLRLIAGGGIILRLPK